VEGVLSVDFGVALGLQRASVVTVHVGPRHPTRVEADLFRRWGWRKPYSSAYRSDFD